ncbi:DUF6286 domain-containing protein [Gordonia sp. (in: high G+C Gram-positive bacteria)]|uniref:DUF6286 domain-containing protein n=1 Tax=Gordonia sp. (in: high G+C Gram-positive bacteria) TaxID=84139 RepID=UPI00263843F5|nr:DUF6286 domain-containing protein [Gordonia sp. (in: high G+C Gram-positive bacteria)]
MSRDDSTRVRTPAALPAAALAGAGLGLVLLVLAGIAIRDLIVRAGWISGDEWLRGATDWGTRTGWQAWMWALVVALLVAGLGLLWLAVKPRKHRYVAVGQQGPRTTTWTRPLDVARRCSSAVGELAGVDAVSTVYGRRKVVVVITAAEGVIDTGAVAQTVTEVVEPLTGHAPKVKVRVRGGRSAR